MNKATPSKQNTFVLIVTYNPDFRLCKSINVVRTIFDNIIVVDNNSVSDVKLLLKDISLTFIQNEKNLGIAKALNIGAEFAISHGAEWLLMLDQDTIPRPDILSIYESVYLNYPHKEKIGQIGISFFRNKPIKGIYKNVTTLITSGTLLSLDAYKVIGAFRNDFFIDCVDFEFSLRIKKNGFVNLQSPIVAIDHRLGFEKNNKVLFLSFKSSNHPPLRRYFMARNHLVITKLYFFSFPYWVAKKNFFFIKSLLNIILVDDQKNDKMKKTLLGLKDGIQNRITNQL